MNNSSSGPSSKSKAGSAIPSDGSFKRKRGVFQKDLQHMMYGFGDDTNPLPETVTLVEDIVVEYITDLGEGEDFISGLPDHILSSILSLLPMKDGVKTSILSCRWRYLWAFTPHLDFDINTMIRGSILIQDEEGLRMVNSEFVGFVKRLFIKHGEPRHVPSALSQLLKDHSGLESLFIESTKQVRALPTMLASSAFKNLKELVLEAFCRSVDLLWIASTINALPFLLKLHVMPFPPRPVHIKEERRMKTSGRPHKHLKEVLITGFNPLLYQLELVIYLLKNAVALEQLTIDPTLAFYCPQEGKYLSFPPTSTILTTYEWGEGEIL